MNPSDVRRTDRDQPSPLRLIAFNKPYGVLCQFSPSEGRPVLVDYIQQPGMYPAGRLDLDSEGLVLLTDSGKLQHAISAPRVGRQGGPTKSISKTYWVQVEVAVPETQFKKSLEQLRRGVTLNDGPTRAAEVLTMAAPELWPRDPPVRFRKAIPTQWIEIRIREGRNRQVRRMTAAVGLPTLRLIRVAIGQVNLITLDLAPGAWRVIEASQLGWTIPLETPSERTDARARGTRSTGRIAIRTLSTRPSPTRRTR